jgi:hypothetical protein
MWMLSLLGGSTFLFLHGPQNRKFDLGQRSSSTNSLRCWQRREAADKSADPSSTNGDETTDMRYSTLLVAFLSSTVPQHRVNSPSFKHQEIGSNTFWYMTAPDYVILKAKSILAGYTVVR